MMRPIILMSLLRGASATCAAGQNQAGTNPGSNINLCWQKNTNSYNTGDSAVANFNKCDMPGFCPLTDDTAGAAACEELAAADSQSSNKAVDLLTQEWLLGCQVDSGGNYYFNRRSGSQQTAGSAWPSNNLGNSRQMICVTRDYTISNGNTLRDGISYSFSASGQAGNAGAWTSGCTPYLSPSSPPSVPPSPPPPSPSPPPPTAPPPPLPVVVQSQFDPIILIAILIPVLLLSFCCCGYLYYRFYWKPRRDARYKAPVLTKHEREMQELFMLMDHDMSGQLEVDELRTVLAWLRDNVVGGNSGWLTVMWEKLPIADTGGDRPIVGDAKGGEDITIKTEPIGEPAGEDGVVAVEDLKFVTGGKMNLSQFTAWMYEVTSSFTPEMYEQMLVNLKAFLKKEQDAYRIFTALDADGSLTLDVKELQLMVAHFKQEFEAGDVPFKTVAQEEAEAVAARKAEEEAKAAEAGEEATTAPAAAPAAAVTADVEAPAPAAKTSSYEEWMASFTASVDELQGQTLNLLAFKHWFFGHVDYLSSETYMGAIQPFLDVINRKVEAEDLFDEWDKDKSGALDFKEMGEVLQWFHDNVPTEGGGQLDWAHLWQALTPPADGKIDKKTFKMWLVEITKRIHPETFQAITKKLKKFVGEDFQKELKASKERKKEHAEVTA